MNEAQCMECGESITDDPEAGHGFCADCFCEFQSLELEDRLERLLA